MEQGLRGAVRQSEERLIRPSFQLPRLWLLNLLLFCATLLTTTAFGYALAASFHRGQALDLNDVLTAYGILVHFDGRIWTGLQFSIPLLLILSAHELGHYLECRRRRVDASLPYFLPSPTLFGTVGAFIRIRSPIYTRESLFDIGALGPFAGFVTLVPFLIGGVAMSRVIAHPPRSEAILFGTPLALRLLEVLRFPGVSAAGIALHPVAMAAWVGLFATALNLLPIGQLDGGHIVYSLGNRQWHSRISLAFIALLGVAGFLYWPWWIWGCLMFIFKRHHPLVYDNTPLSKSRVISCAAAAAIFLLSVSIVPVQTT